MSLPIPDNDRELQPAQTNAVVNADFVTGAGRLQVRPRNASPHTLIDGDPSRKFLPLELRRKRAPQLDRRRCATSPPGLTHHDIHTANGAYEHASRMGVAPNQKRERLREHFKRVCRREGIPSSGYYILTLQCHLSSPDPQATGRTQTQKAIAGQFKGSLPRPSTTFPSAELPLSYNSADVRCSNTIARYS